MPLEEILAALQDPQQSDGTLLVGVKEPGAARGVSTTGEELPLAARFAAEEAIRRTFANLEVIRGIERPVAGVGPLGSASTDTIYRTFLVVRPSLNEATLQALRASAYVDYIAPNYTNGILLGASSEHTIIAAASSEAIPWGVDVVRAPDAWSEGYTGGDIMTGLVDTGMDGDPDMHPDLRYPLRFYNLVHDRSDNRCNSNWCFWEDPFHGTGVIGAARALQNGTGSVGVAPSAGTSNSCHAKPWYVDTNGNGRLREEDFVDAVKIMTDFSDCGPARVAVTSIEYISTNTVNYPALHGAFTTSYSKGVLWFAAAGNNGGTFSEHVVIPARFPEVVAVGALNRQLTRSTFSSVGPEVELVAPGEDLRLSSNRRDDNPDGSYTRTVQGTSFAAPIAMGVARLALQKNPGWSAATLRQKMRDHARDLGPSGKDDKYGYGMVDAICLINQTYPCLGPLSVYIEGETYVRDPGLYRYEAVPSGGNGSYTYQWEIRYPDIGGGWGKLGTSKTQDLNIAEGDGDIELRVTVTSAGEAAQGAIRVTNSTGCGEEIIC